LGGSHEIDRHSGASRNKSLELLRQTLVSITCRTVQGRFLLRPRIAEMVESIEAEAARERESSEKR